VEGKLQTSTYEKDGQTHYATDIIAQTVQFLGGGQGGGQQRQQPRQQSAAPQIDETDIPF